MNQHINSIRQRTLTQRLGTIVRKKQANRGNIKHDQSLRSFLKESCCPLVCGFGLTLLGTVLLFWNEGKAVSTAKTLDEGYNSVVSVLNADKIDPENEGKLLHITGTLGVQSPIIEATFGIRVKAVQLKRRVQIYQWIEEETSFLSDAENLPEVHEPYAHAQIWKDKLVDSSAFHVTGGHDNPKSIPIQSETKWTEQATIGQYELSEAVKKVFTKFHSFSGDEEPFGEKIKLHSGIYFISNDIFNPQTGDLRVQFYYAGHDGELVTIVGKQEGGTLHPYITSSGRKLLIIRPGKLTSEEMFWTEHSQSRLSVWSYRITGWFLIFAGATCLSSLIHHFMSLSSLFREIVFLGFGSANLTLSLSLSFVLIGSAWCFYRPGFALTLLLLACLPLFRRAIQPNGSHSDRPDVIGRAFFRPQSGTVC